MESMFPPAGAAAAASFLTCILLLATRRLHGQLTLDSTIGVQKFHCRPTLRVGGIALAVGLCLGMLLAPEPVRRLLAPVLLAAVPAFCAGLWEDLTKDVSVTSRLCATFAGGLLACWLTGVSLTRVNVVGMDWMLGFLPFSVLFSAFAVTGAANAYNIIDGFHGLAAGVVLISLASLATISAQVNDWEMVRACLLVAAVTSGFMLLNFPLGKIFLGDGGAYLAGFVVGWLALMLPMRNPSVSVWASLLACGYPIIETLFSIWRKRRRRGHHPGQPDQVHLHMLLFRRIARRLLPVSAGPLQNAMTSPLAWSYAVVPAAIAAAWAGDTPRLVAGFLLSAALYWAIYLRLTQFRWCLTPATTRCRPSSLPPAGAAAEGLPLP